MHCFWKAQTIKSNHDKKAKRHASLLMLILLLIYSTLYLKDTFYYHVPTWHYQLTERWFDSGRAQCQLRKRPWMQLTSAGIRVAWETNCEAQAMELGWSCEQLGRTEKRQATTLQHITIDKHHHLYSGYIKDCSLGKYQIRGMMGEEKSFHEVHPFEYLSLSEASDRIRLAVIGNSAQSASKFRKVLKTVSSHDAVLHLGNMVEDPMVWREWTIKVIAPMKNLMRNKPLIAVPGPNDITNTGHNPYFLPVSDEKLFWAASLGPARILFLDTNRANNQQTIWLENELSSAVNQKSAFRIVSLHASPFPEYAEEEDLYIRQHWVPLFEKYHVDLVLSSGQHNYNRGWHNHIHYVISGNAATKSPHTTRLRNLAMYKVTSFDHHHLSLEVSMDAISVNAIGASGRSLDTLTIMRKKLYNNNNNT